MADTRRLDGVAISLDGRPLEPALYPQVALVRVEESVLLPDYFAIHFDDPHFELFDKGQWTIGTRAEIAFRAEGDPVVVTSGEVTAISVEPGASGRHELVLTGFDLTHRLARVAKSRSFQKVTDADIASRIAGEYGLDADVDSTGGTHDYVLQAGETDYAFLRRRAARIGFDVWVSEKKFYFKKAPRSTATPPKLVYGKNLSRFSTRFSAAERSDEVEIRGWDNLGKETITGRSDKTDPGTDAPAAQELSDAARRAFGRVKRNAGQFPIKDQAEADALAGSLLLRASGEEVVLHGEATGDPLIGAGAKVHLEGIGSRLTGAYRVTGVEHSWGAAHPYLTRFVCGGKEPAGLADLTGGSGGSTPAEKRGWSGLVVGIVTNNDDPEKLGRVRVKFPTLTQDDESAWSRVATPGGGKQRGLQWIPEVDDEVLVGFELDDTSRPVILGGLWNRRDAPPDPGAIAGGVVKQRMLVSRKDSRVVLDDDKPFVEISLGGTSCLLHLEQSESKLTGDQKLVITATNVEIKATSKLSLSGSQVEITASGPLTTSGKPIKLN